MASGPPGSAALALGNAGVPSKSGRGGVGGHGVTYRVFGTAPIEFVAIGTMAEAQIVAAPGNHAVEKHAVGNVTVGKVTAGGAFEGFEGTGPFWWNRKSATRIGKTRIGNRQELVSDFADSSDSWSAADLIGSADFGGFERSVAA